jgi:hypothetical protein
MIYIATKANQKKKKKASKARSAVVMAMRMRMNGEDLNGPYNEWHNHHNKMRNYGM